MRRLSFTGYLESYVRYLAGRDTLALSQLAALRTEPRLAEPVLLWPSRPGAPEAIALLEGRATLADEVATLVSLELHHRLESALAAEDAQTSARVLEGLAELCRPDAPARDAELKLAARKRVLALEATKGVTRYRMAKDLGLNPGNLHAFLMQGNPSKVSLSRALGLVDYLEAA